MPERVPPPEVPIIKWLSPNKADQGLLEFWNTELASYVPLDIGAAHPNTRLYPGFTLGKQAPMQGDEKWVMRIWVTPETSPEWFNWAEKYSAEDNAYPIFIRTYREPKATYSPRAKKSSLKALYKLVLTDPGSGFIAGTQPAVIFDSDSNTPAVAHGVVAPDGTLTECVLDFCGDGYTGNVAFRVDAPANGNPAEGTAFIQPASAILVKEEASLFPDDSEFYAEYLQVTRVYETLPGPTLVSTHLDEKDGVPTTVSTTRKLCADINTGESIDTGVWTKTIKKETDTDFICEEVKTQRAIPGFPMHSTVIDPDGVTVFRTQTYFDSSACVTEETVAGGVWTEKHFEDVDGTELVSWQWVLTRAVPGNPMVVTKVDDDGKITSVVRTIKAQADIVSSEAIVGGIWKKTYQEDPPIFRGFAIKSSDLVAWEMVEARPVPGNSIPSASVDADHEVATTSRILKDQSTITPSATESGGNIITVEKEKVSDLVSNEVTTVAKFLDKASYSIGIPNLIPQWARAQIPVLVESHVLSGTASAPTLAPGEFSATERQLTKLLYERRVEKIPDTVTFPVTAVQEQWSEEYGGNILTETITLDTSTMTADEGTFIVSSETTTLAVYTGGPPTGLYMKRTLENLDAVWPILTEYDQDPETQSLITTTYQVIDSTTVVAPSIVNGVITRYKRIDDHRSIEIIETYSMPADYEEQRFAAQNFPSLWDFTLYNYSTACGPTGPIRQGFSTMVQARIAISFSATKETITGLTLIPNTIHLVHDVIPAVLNDSGTITYVGTCSGPITFPASSPDFSTYTGSIQGTEQLISGESVLWRAGIYKNSRLYVEML